MIGNMIRAFLQFIGFVRMQFEHTVLDRLETAFGSSLSAAVAAFACSIDTRNVRAADTYASIVYSNTRVGHLVVLKPLLPSILNARARLRAYLEAFERRLPYGMPFCAFAVLPSEWHFFDFANSFDVDVREGFTDSLGFLCDREFASSPLRRYIWDDGMRAHFDRIGMIELP